MPWDACIHEMKDDSQKGVTVKQYYLCFLLEPGALLLDNNIIHKGIRACGHMNRECCTITETPVLNNLALIP